MTSLNIDDLLKAKKAMMEATMDVPDDCYWLPSGSFASYFTWTATGRVL